MVTAQGATEAGQQGWGLLQFCKAASISRSLLYALPARDKPHSVRVGRRRVIVEEPKAWLLRIGKKDDWGDVF